MRDDFEASFDEQLQAIQAEAAPMVVAAPLPPMLEAAPDFAPFCFGYPDPDTPSHGNAPAALLAESIWDPASRERARAILVDYADAEATRASFLSGVDDAAQLAVARILAVLVCAEESAVNMFHHECGRVSSEQVAANQQALREIETEERVHAWLIHSARSYLPEPDDIGSIRRRTRRLFMRVASRDVATHFARITGLDSGVCISLSALLGSAKVNRAKGFARLIKQIRRDEATHVKKSRDHAVDLGFDANLFHDCYDLTRTGMVDMLTPIASSFDDLEVDPDRLFKRLLRFQGNRMPGSGDLED
ncbi:hypothetical protein JN531_007975 [Flagellatimonas centrodinii]|uniref:hypothetical protein n=1 Tax=Flagellatimonas centrodinii TaxID=2806210 RepID=UPI001FFD7EBB|nr:hypothetical protein [Flagellatimonas centrodinii]ULQ48222.1 hypothetical protein JN531_007975 [Flagellatimonas centrodinii]